MDFKAHIATLHDSRIETEARHIAETMKSHAAPNSPGKTHFMVEMSLYFVKTASAKDTDRLFAMLLYKTLAFSTIKDRQGTYALADKTEDRSRNVRKERPSVQAQFAAEKKVATPKKAAAKSKHHDMEV